MTVDDPELVERASWALDRLRELIDADEMTRRLGPAADADHLQRLRDLAGEVVDVARHLAADPRLDDELRARYRRVAKWLDETYSRWNEMYRFLNWQSGADPSPTTGSRTATTTPLRTPSRPSATPASASAVRGRA
jgi:hypothetical protein